MTDDQVAAIKSAATALNADVYYVSGAIAAPRMSTSGRKPNGRADATDAFSSSPPVVATRMPPTEYQRLQKEILEKRRAKTRERVRRVMKRIERAPSPFQRARTRPIDPARHLNDLRTGD